MSMKSVKTNNIMDAKDLYDLIQSSFPSVSEKSVCDLHQPCSDHRGCSIKPSNKYIDFDAVEKEFDKGHESRPSVDAVKNAGAYFISAPARPGSYTPINLRINFTPKKANPATTNRRMSGLEVIAVTRDCSQLIALVRIVVMSAKIAASPVCAVQQLPLS